MRLRASSPFGAAVGLIVLATRLGAQTLPVPVLPPEPSPEPDAKLTTPLPDAAGETPHPGPWEYALGAGVGWDDNVDFLVPHGPSALALVPRGGLARIVSAPRTELRAIVAGAATGYPGHGELRRYSADVGLEWRHTRSPGTRWRGSASYALGYSDSSRILSEQGVWLPVVRTRSTTGALGVSLKAGRSGSLRIDGRFYRTAFDTPGLIDGNSLRGTVGLEQQRSARSTLAAEYSLEYVRSDRAAASYLTHFGSLQWTRVLSIRCALLLEAGASHTPDAASAGLEHQASFFGGASFVRQVKRSSLTLFVRREVAPAFGTVGSRLDLRAGVRASVILGPAWELRLLASTVRPEAVSSAAIDGPGAEAMAGIGLRLGRNMDLSGEARYRRRGGVGAVATLQSFQAGVFLTIRSGSGRGLAPAMGF